MRIAPRGFIALTSVLILSAIFLSMTLSMTTQSISGGITQNALHENEKARYQARACMEYARMELQKTLDYAGDERIMVGEEMCEIFAITGFGNTERIITVESSSGAHTFRIVDTIAEVSPRMIIISSERVVSF